MVRSSWRIAAVSMVALALDLRVDIQAECVRVVQVYQPSAEDLAAAMEPYANTVCMVCLESDDEHLLVSLHRPLSTASRTSQRAS